MSQSMIDDVATPPYEDTLKKNVYSPWNSFIVTTKEMNTLLEKSSLASTCLDFFFLGKIIVYEMMQNLPQ